MKTIYWIRHGLSEGNVGLPTKSWATVHLVDEGRLEAQRLAGVLPPVELVVVSPYCRTRETAQPYLDKYPNIPVEEWSVQEFTYLEPGKYDGTTEPERLPWKQIFWDRCDPDFRESPELESYREFSMRVKESLDRAFARPEEVIAIFSHGLFMRGVLWEVLYSRWDVLAEGMDKFRYQPTMPNGGIMELGGSREEIRMCISTAHLHGMTLEAKLET